MPEFCLPDLGEGLAEAQVVRWLVAPGEEVHVDQPLVEVETAKAMVEVPSPFAGVVTALHAREGESVPVGAPLITIDPRPADQPPAVPTAVSASASPDTGSGSVLVGYGTSTRPARHRRRFDSVEEAAAPVSPPSRPGVISPVVRRLARDGGVDLADVSGTGPDGLILRADVDRALEKRRVGAETTTAPRAEGAAPPSGEAVRIPLTGARRRAADKLSLARREIPEATAWVEVDATDLLALRDRLSDRGVPIGVLALVARFVVGGLRRIPELNSRVEGNEIVQLPGINLGFAAQTDRGLLVPVVHSAEGMSTRELAAAIARLTDRARTGTLTPAELTGGTFTVNSYGAFGTDGAVPILNYPEAGMIGIGRIVDRPWVLDGQIVVRKAGVLTVVFDHRVCDGAVAGGLLRFVADCIEDPASAILDL